MNGPKMKAGGATLGIFLTVVVRLWAMAGSWQEWGPPEARQSTCAVVTTAANQAISAIHHRMPVILDQKDWSLWLGEEGRGAAALMQPAPEIALSAYRVERTVNSNKAKGPDLVRPLNR